MNKQTDIVALAGRILIGVPFLLSGIGKLGAAAATQGYIAAMGLPAPFLAYLGSTAVELIGSVLLIVGFRVRAVGAVLVVFTLMAALFFHSNFADQNQAINFLKNIMIMGGLLQVVAFGSGKFSIDRRFDNLVNLRGTALTAAK